jgi:Uri superfamily endonuclease
LCGNDGCVTPRQTGSYVLILQLPQPTLLTVGKLGKFEFPAGWYAYAGSALGPGGLAARIGRHRKTSKTPHWHIDRLRDRAELTAVWYAVGFRRRECVWARALSTLPGAREVAPGFGASDCRCSTHLLHLPKRPDPCLFESSVGEPVRQEATSV